MYVFITSKVCEFTNLRLLHPRHTGYSFLENVDASLDVVLGHVLNGFYEGLDVPVRFTNKISDNNYDNMFETTQLDHILNPLFLTYPHLCVCYTN